MEKTPRLLVAIALLGLFAVSAVGAQDACVGDCGSDSVVGINELILGVNIALGERSADACPAFACEGAGSVPVNCLVQGVGNALQGCPVTSRSCPVDFADDNWGQPLPVCQYSGDWNPTCKKHGMPIAWYSAPVAEVGQVVTFIITYGGVNHFQLFIEAVATSPTSADLHCYYHAADWPNCSAMSGTATLSDNGRTVSIAPDEAQFGIGGCPFTLYEGELDDVVIR